jgi:hypothetical protein
MTEPVPQPKTRVVPCPHCGAPVSIDPSAGAAACPSCGAHIALPARAAKRPDSAESSSNLESSRLERLRAQDGKPLLPPPDMRHLMRAGVLSPDQADEAAKMWRRTRDELAAGGTAALEERLYFLTLLLYQHYNRANDYSKSRALLEEASSLLTDKRYVQETRCMLARSAVLRKEYDVAEKWLALCDPAPDDLHMDTAFRMSTAYLATVRGDWDTALRCLGQNIDEIPIADESDGFCGVMRANALERKGQLDKAKLQMRQLVGNPKIGHATIASTVNRLRETGIQACLESFVETPPKTRSGLSPLLRFGVPAALIVAGAVVAGAYFARDVLPFDTGADEDTLKVGGVLALIGVIQFIAGVFAKRLLGGAAGSEQFRREGVAGKAEIVAIEPTGWTINDVPQYRFDLMISAPTIEPYQASVKLVMKDDQKPHFFPGVTIGVRIDPKKPKRFVLDM